MHAGGLVMVLSSLKQQTAEQMKFGKRQKGCAAYLLQV